MLEISYVKSTAKLFGAELPKDTPEKTEALSHFYAKAFTICDEPAVCAICAANRLAVVLYGLSETDFRRLDKLIIDAYRELLPTYGISAETISQYLPAKGRIRRTSATNRRYMAWLNIAINELDILLGSERSYVSLTDGPLQVHLTRSLNRRMVTLPDRKPSEVICDNGYELPEHAIMVDLERKYGKKAIDRTAFRIRATMKFREQLSPAVAKRFYSPRPGEYCILREFVIPGSKTFADLDATLQYIFGWHNEHLHQFTIPVSSDSVHYLIPTWHLDDFEGDNICKAEDKVRLSEYLSDFKNILYEYDLGDGWTLELKVIAKLKNRAARSIIVESCEGVSAWENAGGIYGLIESLEAMQKSGTKKQREFMEAIGWLPATPDPNHLTIGLNSPFFDLIKF